MTFTDCHLPLDQPSGTRKPARDMSDTARVNEIALSVSAEQEGRLDTEHESRTEGCADVLGISESKRTALSVLNCRHECL